MIQNTGYLLLTYYSAGAGWKSLWF